MQKVHLDAAFTSVLLLPVSLKWENTSTAATLLWVFQFPALYNVCLFFKRIDFPKFQIISIQWFLAAFEASTLQYHFLLGPTN